MGIELKFISSITGRRAKNQGNKVPDWFGNENDRSSWYLDGTYSYFYNMVSGTTNSMYIQYGNNNENWASGRFFVQDLQITNEKENPNGSIDITIRSRMRSFKQRKRDGLEYDGYAINYKFRILGSTVFNYTGHAGDNITQGASDWITKTFTVNPQETIQETGIEFNITYTEGEASDSELFLGFGLFNPNEENYIPMAIRKSGTWKDLNSNNGKIQRRLSGKWQDKSYENTLTSKKENSGKNRIRRNDKWYQLPKMKGGNV